MQVERGGGDASGELSSGQGVEIFGEILCKIFGEIFREIFRRYYGEILM